MTRHNWSCEYVFIAGLRRWLSAYPGQSNEMLFDAHARAFEAFGGIPRRGVYDNMKTAVDKVGVGKARSVNARIHNSMDAR